jgi:hypothetical protein
MTARELNDTKVHPRIGLIVAVGLTWASIVGLTGCEQSRDALGLNKKPPDEFAVVTRAPLVIPPEATLRPPRPGAQRPQEYQPSEQAQVALFDNVETPASDQSGGPSQAELALLRQAGAERANPNIRALLRQESSAYVRRDARFVDRLMFWRGAPPPDGEVVDASKEAERLRENAATGQLVTEGETPVIIERKSKAFLEDVFF